ncbi:MAG: hypothetical protein HN644_13925 [Rhodospirillales bacterium]|jgi:hypothetical protein|nr:hypothetical protein [Rhodospirillales bacterium]MBT5521106.1 hypothetical protein [Rhodospirillales bacterium]MBT6825768.1 hypothetical protein [Rhodospirillales bacterium]MBT7507370.1 hypothetical protein [Rhodospirillales bacterium]
MVEDVDTGQLPMSFDDPAYQACYAYWLNLKADRWAPTWREWDWMALPTNLIPYFQVVDVHYNTEGAPTDYTYRFWGTANAAMHQVDMTGKSVNEIRSLATRNQVIKQYNKVVEQKQATGSFYVLQTVENNIPHTQISLRMPASDDGERIDQIISFSDWRDELRNKSPDEIMAYSG